MKTMAAAQKNIIASNFEPKYVMLGRLYSQAGTLLGQENSFLDS
jgi:hypothetical protein